MTRTMSTPIAFLAGIGVAVIPLLVPWVHEQMVSEQHELIPSLSRLLPWTSVANAPPTSVPDDFVCQPHSYKTQIISLDPLVVYLDGFLHDREIDSVLAASEPLLKPSTVTKHGVTTRSDYRTSWSAEVPRDNPAVRCIEARVWDFMGTMMARGKDAVEPPQVVRYTAGQRFGAHHDWYETPQADTAGAGGRMRAWNRLASFFAVLQDNCTGGETHFPRVLPYTDASPPGSAAVGEGDRRGGGAWRSHEDGGIAFRPVRGNAVFWVNLFPSGEGDERTDHAGLPVASGVKTAMNIWPRRYMGPGAWDSPPGDWT